MASIVTPPFFVSYDTAAGFCWERPPPVVRYAAMQTSYVVTIFNKAAYLPNVLKAVEAEWRETGGEIILVNDGSTDCSGAILADFSAGRNHVLLHNQRNAGVTAATNLGFSLASYPLVRFVDGDDLIVRGSTRLLIQALKEGKAGFAFGRFAFYEENAPDVLSPDLACFAPKRVADPLQLMIRTQPFIPSTTLVLRQAVAACFPLPEKYCTSQDYLMGLRFARKTSFVEVDGICCWSPAHEPDRLSSSKARMFAESTLILADEMQADPPWPASYRRLAVRRAAGRALLYAERHLHCSNRRILWLAFIRATALFPSARSTPNLFRDIAATYTEALQALNRYP